MTQGLVEDDGNEAIPLWPVAKASLSSWRAERPVHWQAWLDRTAFNADLGTFAVLPDAGGSAGPVVLASTMSTGTLAKTFGLPQSRFQMQTAG